MSLEGSQDWLACIPVSYEVCDGGFWRHLWCKEARLYVAFPELRIVVDRGAVGCDYSTR